MDTTGLLIGRREKNELVIVTNCTGHEVPVGTRLRQLIKHQVAMALPDIHRIDLGEVAAVDLFIEEITLKQGGVPIEAIPIGWSAAIRLGGGGLETVLHILGDVSEDEQIFLR